MPLLFQPKPRAVIVCDFSTNIVPEMTKKRPVIVIKQHKRNSKLVTIVPLSTTEPKIIEPYHYRLKANPLPDRNVSCWAKCDMVSTVSVYRLSLYKPKYQDRCNNLFIGKECLDGIYKCIASYFSFKV